MIWFDLTWSIDWLNNLIQQIEWFDKLQNSPKNSTRCSRTVSPRNFSKCANSSTIRGRFINFFGAIFGAINFQSLVNFEIFQRRTHPHIKRNAPPSTTEGTSQTGQRERDKTTRDEKTGAQHHQRTTGWYGSTSPCPKIKPHYYPRLLWGLAHPDEND